MVRIALTADDSFAAIRARSRFGMAIAAIIRIIATTISNSISENPFSFCISFSLFSRLASVVSIDPIREFPRISPTTPQGEDFDCSRLCFQCLQGIWELGRRKNGPTPDQLWQILSGRVTTCVILGHGIGFVHGITAKAAELGEKTRSIRLLWCSFFDSLPPGQDLFLEYRESLAGCSRADRSATRCARIEPEHTVFVGAEVAHTGLVKGYR